MKLLLDTHAFIWAVSAPERLSNRARNAVQSSTNTLVWSAIGSAEVAIKFALGKLRLPEPPPEFLARHIDLLRAECLALRNEHAWKLAGLPLHHGDPFDRLLIAQAMVEDLPIVTGDPAFKRYGVEVIW